MKSSSFLKKESVEKNTLQAQEEAVSVQPITQKDIDIPREKLQLFLRAFKAEQCLEVWVKSAGTVSWQFFKRFPFCRSSGNLGPKRKEGDRQIPEGCYHINRFNPKSKYHLSLGLNYPNNSDRILGDPREPGSDIFIHGGCETVGCIPITDTGIEAVYALAGWARSNGQIEIPVHIYPFRFSAKNWGKYGAVFPQHHRFWKQLEVVYLAFEKEQILPAVQITEDGKYTLR